MGCCGGLSSSATGIMPVVAIPPEGTGQRYLQSGENVECWANRTVQTEDKSGAAGPSGKITTAAIAAGCDLSFTQSIDAVPPKDGTTTSWDNPKFDPEPKPGITWQASQNNGKFTGKFDKSDENKTFKVEITANFSDGTKDTKSYNLKPVTCNPGDDSVQFCNPQPGARVTAPFGEIRPSKQGGTRGHGGLDFGGGKGICVAAADGVVLSCNGSGTETPGFTGYGNYVLIQHKKKNGKPLCNTFYAHLASVSVSKDQQVSQGQQIGVVGGSGSKGPSTYPAHLHFEMHANGQRKDPLPYIHPKPELKASEFAKPQWTGSYSTVGAGIGSSNYGTAPTPGSGQTTSGADGYQTASNPNENAKNAYKGEPDSTCPDEPPLSENDPDTPVVGNDPPCVDFLTLQQLQKAMPKCGNKCNVYLPHFNATIKQYIIDDLTDKCGPEARKRVAMFLAQCAHECHDLLYREEIASGQKYEGRVNGLGNTQPGDGPRFKGRGVIQLTGRSNYQNFSDYKKRPDIMTNPSIIASDTALNVEAAGFFWKRNKLNGRVSDVKGCTKVINGGYNGLADREQRWATTKGALQVA